MLVTAERTKSATIKRGEVYWGKRQGDDKVGKKDDWRLYRLSPVNRQDMVIDLRARRVHYNYSIINK